MATAQTEYTSESTTIQRLRAHPEISDGSDADVEEPRPRTFQHTWDYLGLIDIEAFAKLQLVNSGPIGKSNHLGSPSQSASLLLGRGGSFVVRRVWHSAVPQSLNVWDEPFDKTKGFVVIKQPIAHTREPLGDMSQKGKDFKKRLWDAMMELKVSYHAPLRKHPNIVKLHSFMWDTQSNLGTALAPSLILEYVDLGTLSDFQTSKRLTLHADAKSDICLDVARGLSFLHMCGIIHGDVKCENILLFRSGIQDKHRAIGILAKVGDFGSSLIGVLDEPSCPKQALPARTDFWDTPEEAVPMESLGLRRMDMYSYGIAVWRTMCNGKNPFHRLYRDHSQKISISKNEVCSEAQIKVEEILQIKQEEDTLLRLAITTFTDRPKSDIDAEKAQRVLEVTMRRDPTSRVSNFEDIVNIWCRNTTQNDLSLPDPKPLIAGDFGITSTKFPNYIHLLRTTPSSFRSLICSQLSEYSKSSSTDSRKALYHLALAVCHFQGFFPSEDKGSEQIQSDHIALGASKILTSAALGNPIAQSLTPSAFATLQRTDANILSEWLANAMRHGSIRARNEMKKLFPEKFTDTVAKIQASRHQVASSLTPDSKEAYEPEFVDQFPALDPAAKAVLSQSGLSRLHQAAYLGNLEVCKNLIEIRKQDVDIQHTSQETPLHYAVRSGQCEIARYLLKQGASVDANRAHGAGVLHLAFLSYNADNMLQLLLAKGADIKMASSDPLEELPDKCDYLIGTAGTSLHFAIRCGQMESADILLKAGADPNKQLEYILSPLQTAIQMHSMPLLEFIMPWAITNSAMKTAPDVQDLYSPLVGFYVQPIFRWVYWSGKTSLDFFLPAIEFIKGHQLSIDVRVLLSWALDADDTEVVGHYLKKLFTTERSQLKPFRDSRPNNSDGISGSPDFPLSPDLKQVLSMILTFSNKEIIKIVLNYMEQPVSDYNTSGNPFIYQLAFRQAEPKADLNAILTLLIEAGIDIRATGSRADLGPLRNASTWNNFNLADVLLDNNPSLVDVQAAMEVCFRKGNSMIAERIMRPIFEKCSEVLVVALPAGEKYTDLPVLQPDCNYLRSFCSWGELSTLVRLSASMLSEVIQYTKCEPGGPEALRERLKESTPLKHTPLHYAVFNGNLAAVEILLSEGANINAYDVSPITGPGYDLSTTTCTVDLSTLDDLQKVMIFSASGPTPLDQAYQRDWESSLPQWPSSHGELVQELRLAGGAYKEEGAYEERTKKMIEFLRAHGGKTRNELFGKPSQHQKRKVKYETKLPSDTSQRVLRFWGASCGLQSAQNTLSKYPSLLSRSDPARPRFSQMFAKSIELFTRILARLTDLKEENLSISCEAELSKYQIWARRNGVEEKNLDPISDIAPFGQSIILAASIFVSLHEIICTLGYLEDILIDPRDLIDRKHRCEKLLKDIEKVVGVLTAEEMSLKTLSDLAIVEAEEQLQVKREQIDKDGHLKIN